jgi:hypothetical protein
MGFNLNQFKLTNLQGLVMNPAANVIQAVVLPTLATTTYYSAGLVVSFGSVATNACPVVQQAVSGTGGIGIIVFNAKRDTFYANEIVGVALDGTIINCVAGAPISRQQVVAYGSTASNIPNVTGCSSGIGVGIALDVAAAAGDIIRVLVKSGIAYNAAF